MDMQVYIANLGKYNEGYLVGDWFTPPIDIEEVKERIGLNEIYEEYAIHDYELPFDIGEYISIEDINRKCEMAQELLDEFPEDDISEIEKAFFSSIEEFYENKKYIIRYCDCNSMADVAMYYINEFQVFGEIPQSLINYIDYTGYGRDLEMSGNFLITSNYVYEYRN